MTTYFPPTVTTETPAVAAAPNSNLVAAPYPPGTDLLAPPSVSYLQPVVTQAGPVYPPSDYSNVGPVQTTTSRQTGLEAVAPQTGNERPYPAPPVQVYAGEVFVKTL